MEGGSSGNEAFSRLLRPLTAYFDHVDTGEGYTKLRDFWIVKRHALSRLQSGVSRASVHSYGERARFGSGDRRGRVGGGSDGGKQAILRLLRLRCTPWFEGEGPAAVRLRWVQ